MISTNIIMVIATHLIAIVGGFILGAIGVYILYQKHEKKIYPYNNIKTEIEEKEDAENAKFERENPNENSNP